MIINEERKMYTMLGYAFTWLTATKDAVVNNPTTSVAVVCVVVLAVIAAVMVAKKK